MSELPAGWALPKIEELIVLNPKNAYEDKVKAGFVPMPKLGTEFRSSVEFESRLWGEIRKSYTHFADGDVLLAKITPCFENGKAGYVQGMPNGIGAGSSEYFVCRPVPDVLSPKLLLAMFKTEQFLKQGAVEMTGSVGHKRVPKDFLLNTEFPLPPWNEQKRIADKLDAVLARVDACRERLDRIPAILKRFRQSVLAAATSGKLTEEWRELQPNLFHWRKVTLADVISEMRNGLATRPDENSAGQRILRISAVRPGVLDVTDHRYLTTDAKESSVYALQKGDLLYTRYNGTLEFVGVCAMVRNDMPGYVYPDKLIRVRVKAECILPSYLEFVSNAIEAREQIEGFIKSSAGQKGISGVDLKSVILPIPCLAEQAEIVSRVESLFAYADRIEAQYSTARAQVERLTPSLLAKAFRGELVPQDPNDEPASALLERIQAEHAAHESSKFAKSWVQVKGKK